MSNPIDHQHRTCKCDHCQKWAPLHNRIQSILCDTDKKLFDEYLTMVCNDSDELGIATSKLDGEWPGWEWMKEEVKKHRDLQ